ncbi:vegetative cell wall protein gp1-like [Helianthus annuus]|uniref:vegetative cell wall protein gp1-like n=1 Tax=Helianthus annuus TaxID=4232 RepID=UPI000B907A83|nr:vegetative cell wall protein gp1-like [Helianthus annuus]
MAMSAAPGPSHEFEFDHEVDDDSDLVFPPNFDPDHDIEFIHMDQPLEAPVAPIDLLFDIPTDFDMDLVDPEPVMAPEPVVDRSPVLDDAPAVAPPDMGAPAIAPFVDDMPITDLPIVAPPAVDDPVVDAPIPDPVPALIDRAPFAAHIDPRYADTRNGWIEDDHDYPPFVLPVTPPVAPVSAPPDIPFFPPHTTDAHRTDLPITFLQDIPPPRPEEGSSRQPPVSVPPVPSSFPFMLQ